MLRKTYDERAVELLLAGDQAGVERLAREARDFLENRVECPACGSKGPHDDNGCTGEDLSYCCTECGEHFDAVDL